MVNVNIEYPIITLAKDPNVQKKINIHFIKVANEFYNYALNTLLPNAIEQYEASIKQDYPFNPYEAFMKYTLTLNDNCTLSTYYDQYEYTGGAHGMTIRSSDTFNLQNGNIIKLKDLFKENPDYKNMIIKEIQIQADKNLAENPGIYFDNYKALISENFNENNFYLTQKTINFYYQQYDIAPYSSGIVTFAIPYENLKIKSPQCTFTKKK
ncbi:MAG: hypothetical protein K0R72_1245 [Clostridia bacterium]|jgi:hypothetical protein|nr:hypothetical protein [Clostridia bacterium]